MAINDVPSSLRAIGLGAVLLDNINLVEKFPDADYIPSAAEQKRRVPHQMVEKIIAQQRLGDTAFDQVGGPVPTALRVYRAWGTDAISFVGAVGNDATGAAIADELNRRQYKALLFKQDGRESGRSQVWIDANSGENRIVFDRGTLDKLRPDAVMRVLDDDLSDDTSFVLHLDATEPQAAKELVKDIANAGGSIYLDTGDYKEYEDGTNSTSLLKLADVVQAPRRFAIRAVATIDSSLGESAADLEMSELAELLRKFGNNGLVVVTDGDRGAGFSARQEFRVIKRFVPAYQGSISGVGDETKDETSAGDLFGGALSFALRSGEPAANAVRIAAVAAASSTRAFGNSTFIGFDQARDLAKGLSLMAHEPSTINFHKIDR